MSSEVQTLPFGNDVPNTLFELALDVIVENLDIISTFDATLLPSINKDVILPSEICDKFLEAYQRRFGVDDYFAELFSDKVRTRLTMVSLRNSRITNQGFQKLMEHKPHEVALVNCEFLATASLEIISKNSENLVSLKIGPRTNLISHCDLSYKQRGYVLYAPHLKRLVMRGGCNLLHTPLFFNKLLHLTHLDLSEVHIIGSLEDVPELMNLKSLILYGIYCDDSVVDWIICHDGLRHLDISQSNDKDGQYPHPNELLMDIVDNLPHLESLDISGTNLAGNGKASKAMLNEMASSSKLELNAVRCDIPGLISRVGRPLEFLGLYGTSHEACNWHDIPAKVISGNKNEEQILAAAEAYIERPAVLTRVLNDLYYFFRNDIYSNVAKALFLVLDAMDKNLSQKHIQISGSATLFYIVKGKEKEHIGTLLKRRIITVLLNGMEAHLGDDTIMRNGCLSLCQFKIPTDVLFEYERVVEILLNGVSDSNQDDFIRRIAIYLLNSLACQVNGSQKRLLGSKGAIQHMLNIISQRLNRRICDDVLEVAWSTMWNVTDETPSNCYRFLEGRGMEYFLACLKNFPDKDELLRNMMGLLGNVAEVANLRPNLMDKRFLSVFYDLLESSSDGIEVSYNAAGVLVHIASDGPEAWTVNEPARELVLYRITAAVQRWDLHAERNINYRSFEPILGLLHVYHTPQCQHWAVWALANLTTVYPEKYCNLVKSEGGLKLLSNILAHPAPYNSIKTLARTVISNCENFSRHCAVTPPVPILQDN